MDTWSQLLSFINQLVSPDWAAVIALLPVGLAGLVVLYIAWVVVRFASAGPRRRGGRLSPRPPAGVHMPGPSLAPFIGAVGMFILMYSLVFGGPWLAIGLTALILGLLYWGRETIRDFGHVDPASVVALPAVEHPGPPPGVHMPGPSFRPLIASLAMAILFYGLVFGGLLLFVGLICLVTALLQWLGDARSEYKGVVQADVTGHLPAAHEPGVPRGTLTFFAILVAGAVIVQAGILPPRSAVAGPVPGASGAPSPGASAAPGSAAPSSAAPASAVTGDVTITARGIAFDPTDGSVAAGKAFTMAFLNEDAGTPHNVAIYRDSATGAQAFKGDVITGVASVVYEVPALDAGSYVFICSVHPNMTGTLTVK
jgi:plastocyanin